MPILLQLICDECKKVVLEKIGEKNLNLERFPITNEEAEKLNKESPWT